MFNLYDIPLLHQILLKALLDITHIELTKNKIKYWIDGGTLLGAIREGNLIKHDDDVDIGILYKDFYNKLPKALEKINNYTICINDVEYLVSVQISDFIIKIFIPNLWVKTDSDRIIGTPTLDIFPWRKNGDIVELYSHKQQLLFRNCFYRKTELFPLKLYKFGDNQYFGANNGIPYLNRYYGMDWNIPKVEIRTPENNNLLKKEKSLIKIDFD